jgi:hypothetical protein
VFSSIKGVLFEYFTHNPHSTKQLKDLFLKGKAAGDCLVVCVILLYILIFHVSFCLPVNLKYCIFAGVE